MLYHLLSNWDLIIPTNFIRAESRMKIPMAKSHRGSRMETTIGTIIGRNYKLE